MFFKPNSISDCILFTFIVLTWQYLLQLIKGRMFWKFSATIVYFRPRSSTTVFRFQTTTTARDRRWAARVAYKGKKLRLIDIPTWRRHYCCLPKLLLIVFVFVFRVSPTTEVRYSKKQTIVALVLRDWGACVGAWYILVPERYRKQNSL